MADDTRIVEDIAVIRTSILGKDVREAIADALESLFEESGSVSIDGLDVSEDGTGIAFTYGAQ